MPIFVIPTSSAIRTCEPRNAVHGFSEVDSGLSVKSMCDKRIPPGEFKRASARPGGRSEGSGWSARIFQPSGEVDTAGKRDKVT